MLKYICNHCLNRQIKLGFYKPRKHPISCLKNLSCLLAGVFITQSAINVSAEEFSPAEREFQNKQRQQSQEMQNLEILKQLQEQEKTSKPIPPKVIPPASQGGKAMLIKQITLDVGTLNLSATEGLSNAGQVISANALSISSPLFRNSGQVRALNGLSIHVSDLDNNGGLLSSDTDLDVVALNQMQNRNGGGIDVKENIRITANTFSNAELSTIVARTGLIDVQLSQDAFNAGRLMANKTLNMRVGGNLLNQKTSSGKDAEDAALIYGATGVLLDVVGDINNLNAANIQSGQDANIEMIAKGLTNNQQSTITGESVKIKAETLSNQNEAIIRALKENDAMLDIDLSGNLSNSGGGKLLSNKDINIKAGSLGNSGEASTIYASGKIKADVLQGVSNTAQAQILGQQIELDAQSLSNDEGAIQAGLAESPASTDESSAISTDMQTKDASLSISLRGDLSNTAGARLLSNKDINIKAASLVNTGEDSTIFAKGKIKAELQQGINNADKARLVGQEIELDANTLDNDAGIIQAGSADSPAGKLSIDLVQSLLNRNNGLILATGNAQINANELHNTTRAQLVWLNNGMNITTSSTLGRYSSTQTLRSKIWWVCSYLRLLLQVNNV